MAEVKENLQVISEKQLGLRKVLSDPTKYITEPGTFWKEYHVQGNCILFE